MFVNQGILEDLYKDAGESRREKAIRYQRQGRVEIKKLNYTDSKNFEVVAKVHGTDNYNTYVNIENGVVEDVTCTCQDYYNYYGVCKHTLATVLEIANNPQHIGQKVDNNIEIENVKEKMNNFLEKTEKDKREFIINEMKYVFSEYIEEEEKKREEEKRKRQEKDREEEKKQKEKQDKKDDNVGETPEGSNA